MHFLYILLVYYESEDQTAGQSTIRFSMFLKGLVSNILKKSKTL